MKVRLKKTGEWIDVYKEGSAISKSGVVGVYYRFNDEYKKPIYGDELVFEKYNDGEALLYAVNKTAERTKREVIDKASKFIYDTLFNWADDNGLTWDQLRADYIKKFKQAMEE